MKNKLLVLTRETEWDEFEATLKSFKLPNLDLVVARSEVDIESHDVFETEPLPSTSPLWNVPNLYITPHVSGYSLSKEIFRIFKENYMRFYEGKELLYQVDFDRGY